MIPITEWSWVGIQLVGVDLDDTNFNDNFIPGALVPRCTDASSRNCYREPCTDLPVSTDTPGLAADTTGHHLEVAVLPQYLQHPDRRAT